MNRVDEQPGVGSRPGGVGPSRNGGFLFALLLLVTLSVSRCESTTDSPGLPSPPAQKWERTFENGRAVERVRECEDGGFVIGGEGRDSGPWVAKLSSQGNLIWEKSLNKRDHDLSHAWPEPLPDGGYIVTTGHRSVTNDYCGGYVRVVKLDSMGEILWEFESPDEHGSSPRAVLPTEDGGWVIGGCSTSGYMNPFNSGGPLPTLWRIDSAGKLLWVRVYEVEDGAYELLVTMLAAEDGYVFLSQKEPYLSSYGKARVRKVSYDGNIEWEKDVQQHGKEEFVAMCSTFDGGYLVLGRGGGEDTKVFISRLDAQFEEIWNRAYPICQELLTLAAFPDDTFALGGACPTDEYIATDEKKSVAAWANFDGQGDVRWWQFLDTDGNGLIQDMIPVSTGGYVVSGIAGLENSWEIAWVVAFEP